MFARIIQFNLGPDKQELVDELVEKFDSFIRSQPGFQEVKYLGNEATGDYACLTVWESLEAMDAAVENMRPPLQEAIQDLIQGQFTAYNYEIR